MTNAGTGGVLGLVAVVACSMAAAPVFCAELELAEAPSFNEQFSGNTKVSGQFLAGLAYASGAEKLDLDAFTLSYSGTDKPPLVCVRLTSEDGRYWAANLYRAKGDMTSRPRVPVKTAYETQLGAYGPGALLILATFADSCQSTAGGVHVPGVFGTMAATPALLAYVNVSQSRVQARLRASDGTTAAEVRCSKPDGGAKVTYSHLCEMPSAALARGRYTLTISVKGLTGKAVEQDYAVLID